jgi:hypothetical protein
MKTREEAQKTVNYDESKIPALTLPSPLDKADGSNVRNAFEWVNFQRPRILEMYKNEVYGQLPPRPDRVSFELLSCKKGALDGLAIRKEYRIAFEMNNGKSHAIDMLLYIPENAEKPVPAFLGLNFKGNHAATPEKDVRITGRRMPDLDGSEESRGTQVDRWYFKETVRRGYASGTICYHDIFPDGAGHWDKSIYPLFFTEAELPSLTDRYSAISAWAWGLSRALDCLETEPLVNASRVAVHGHSRLGKSSLWAGANDARFRLVITNNSGCAGASLFKRNFGENVAVVKTAFPHWFRTSFAQYMENEQAMAFDQHFLISLMAPRPVCIASATEDLWADPKGEFLSGVHAAEVYRLFGAEGLGTDVMPPPETPLTGEISYHLRTGKHDQTPADWAHYLDLADIYLK